MLLLYKCLENLANHLMLLKKKRGREEKERGSEGEEEEEERDREEGGRGKEIRKGGGDIRKKEGGTAITHHNHFAILNFSDKTCFFAIPFLYVNELVSIQANNRLRAITKSRT